MDFLLEKAKEISMENVSIVAQTEGNPGLLSLAENQFVTKALRPALFITEGKHPRDYSIEVELEYRRSIDRNAAEKNITGEALTQIRRDAYAIQRGFARMQRQLYLMLGEPTTRRYQKVDLAFDWTYPGRKRPAEIGLDDGCIVRLTSKGLREGFVYIRYSRQEAFNRLNQYFADHLLNSMGSERDFVGMLGNHVGLDLEEL